MSLSVELFSVSFFKFVSTNRLFFSLTINLANSKDKSQFLQRPPDKHFYPQFNRLSANSSGIPLLSTEMFNPLIKRSIFPGHCLLSL